MKRFIYFLIITFLLSCSSTKKAVVTAKPINYYIEKTNADLKNWHHKDIYTDSIPGISLDNAYNFLKSKKADTIIVAIIDSEIDIDHEDLKNQVWVNSDEIPNNNIDDDNNGYIDDIHGWNFIGTKIGDTIPITNYEFTRIIRRYQNQFKDIISHNVINQNLCSNFNQYRRALLAYKKEFNYRSKKIKANEKMLENFIESEKVASSFFPNKNFSISALDSIYKKSSDQEIKNRIKQWKIFFENNYTIEDIEQYIKTHKLIKSIGLKINFNDRYTTQDNPHDINDVPYGNNNIQGTGKIDHGTRVMSILVATRNNKIGTDGISNSVKVMSIGVSVAGNEFDKDIALAIRYAVDNGAKIINMSIGKEFSMHPEWLKEAIQYAESKDVLIVSSAGNKSYNLEEEFDYPDDYDAQGEYAQNFIKVGASSYKADSTFVWLSSNYSKKNVDIFAPGHKIYSITRQGNSSSSGTSYASPIVAGIASLIRSYYPNLSAVEVKNIILKSGISYDIDVVQPYPYGEKQPEQKIPFQSMSKSGKIVNAYNALLLAEKFSKAKKK